MGLAADKRLIVALDCADEASAEKLVQFLDPCECRLKVGKELFTRVGPRFIEHLQRHGFDVFLDLKFHDIPNTVAAACRAAADLGVWMLNVHALGGPAMLKGAREAIEEAESAVKRRPLLTAVTVLTSHDQQTFDAIGLAGPPKTAVQRLAGLAQQAGLDGVVCSAQEAADLRNEFGYSLCLVTPGIRPRSHNIDDQRRVVTPAEAIRAGADYLVVGRPITRADNPPAAVNEILEEINSALHLD